MTTTEIRVREGRPARRGLAFLARPRPERPGHVAPDLRVVRKLVRGRAALSRRTPWQIFFAEDRDGPAATLTVLHPRSLDGQPTRIATIGFADFRPDAETAFLELVGRAEAWAREDGALRVRAPVNGILMYGFGCLEDHFDAVPPIGTAWNGPEAAAAWFGAGYRTARRFHSFRIDLGRPEVLARAEATTVPEGVTLRPADRSRWLDEVDRFCDLHNEAFRGNWGELDLSREEQREVLADARRVVDPETFLFAEADGRTVGFVLVVPDLNQAFAGSGGEPSGWRAARALLFRRRHITRAVLHAVGVVDDARGRGIGRALVARALGRLAQRGYGEVEYALVLEENTPSRLLAEHFGGRLSRMHRVFEKRLDRDGGGR